MRIDDHTFLAVPKWPGRTRWSEDCRCWELLCTGCRTWWPCTTEHWHIQRVERLAPSILVPKPEPVRYPHHHCRACRVRRPAARIAA